ncbi:MAG: hypothetical protein VX278_05980 [Myxococcota bacterium]|nr:hypothetical protein [Myxococcota bacterium]
MNISEDRFEYLIQGLLDQSRYILLIQFALKWSQGRSITPVTSMALGRSYASLLLIEQAWEIVEAALETNPNDVNAHILAVDLALLQEKWERAQTHMEKLPAEHVRMSELEAKLKFLPTVQISSQSLLKSKSIDRRLEGVELLIINGQREKALVLMRRLRHIEPQNLRIQQLIWSLEGDFRFDGDDADLYTLIMEVLGEEEIEVEETVVESFGEEDEVTESSPFPVLFRGEQKEEEKEKQEDTSRMELGDSTGEVNSDGLEETDALVVVGFNPKSLEYTEDVEPERVKVDENIVITHLESKSPEVLLQKETVENVSATAQKPKREFVGVLFSIFVVLSLVLGCLWFIWNRGKNNIHQSATEAILAADYEHLKKSKKILEYHINKGTPPLEYRNAHLALVCSFLWYDFTRSDTERTCAEEAIQRGGGQEESKMAEVLLAIGDGDFRTAADLTLPLDESNVLTTLLLSELRVQRGDQIGATGRSEPRYVLLDLKNNHPVDLPKSYHPWLELASLEKDWTLESIEQKESRLNRLLEAKSVASLSGRLQAHVLLLRSLIYMEQGKGRLAKNERLEALRKDPTNPDLQYWLGWDYYEDLEIKQASQAWEHCQYLRDDCAASRFMSLLELDLIQSAENLLLEIKDKHPRSTVLEEWLAWAKQKVPSHPSPLLGAMGESRWERVFTDVRIELEKYENKELYQHELSWLGLLELGLKMYQEQKYVESQKHISMAIQKQPHATRLLRILGWVLHESGSDVGGVWQLYLQNEPNGQPSQEVEELLGEE